MKKLTSHQGCGRRGLSSSSRTPWRQNSVAVASRCPRHWKPLSVDLSSRRLLQPNIVVVVFFLTLTLQYFTAFIPTLLEAKTISFTAVSFEWIVSKISNSLHVKIGYCRCL